MKSSYFAAIKFSLLLIFCCSSLSAFALDDFSTFQVGDFTFKRPADWQWVIVTSPMRKAQLRINEKSGTNSADVIFFQFGSGPAGGAQANVERWFRQFSEPRDQIHAKTETADVAGTKITFAEAEGTYNVGMPGTKLTPTPGFALVGAVIESTNGNVFVRLTGPKSLVHDSAATFKKMITGLKKS